MRIWLLVPVLLLGCKSSLPPPGGPWTSPLERDHSLVGRIWDVQAGRFVSEDALRGKVEQSRFVLAGEKHDNPDHHRLQAMVIDWVVSSGRRPGVVFEMLEASLQPEIDRQLEAAPEDVEAFRAAVRWDSSGWPAWSMYRPVFTAALEGGLPVVAASLPRAQAMEIARGNAEVSPELAKRYALDQPLPDPLRASLEKNLDEGHCGYLSKEMIDPMIEVQRIRDAMMARGLETAAAGGDGGILIAGGGHVREDRGVPYYLAPHVEGEILTIGFAEVEAETTSPEAYAERYGAEVIPYDYLWFTPRANDIDHCAELKKQMERMKQRSP